MRKIFISGITGTLGQAVSKILLEDPQIQIIGLARDEQKLRKLRQHKNLTLYLGDVRDRDRIQEATRNVDLVFHFASLKCVDFLEQNPDEAIKTIVLGTENILHAQRTNKIPRVTFTSTDKATMSVNAYGAAKFLAECLILRNKNNVVVRYGNVLASRGSVVPDFVKTLQKEKTLYLTDEKMTRFFMTAEEASDFVIQKGFGSASGLFIKEEMKSVYMQELGIAIAEIMGIPKPTIKITGVRAGEKMHEDLKHSFGQSIINSFLAKKYSKEELYKILTPIVNSLREKPRPDLIRRKAKEAFA